jgi:chromate transporter
LRPGIFAAPKAKHGTAHAENVDTSAFPIILDDHTPTPAHAKISKGRLALLALVFAVLLAAPLAILAGIRGYNDIFATMGRFFTLAAFITVGGAYAVLPYVQQMSTNVYGWLRPGQMMDGLALGETTPGPLILVLTFVGFVGPWNAGLGTVGSIAGAAIATYFTFLPSFMFILLGGPFVEASRSELRIGSVLTAITAAVVGVIANMAIVFGEHYLFPPKHGFDVIAAILTVLAFVALQWRKWDVTLLILVCGAAGVALKFTGLIAL